jgi:D-galacturonate reductase
MFAAKIAVIPVLRSLLLSLPTLCPYDIDLLTLSTTLHCTHHIIHHPSILTPYIRDNTRTHARTQGTKFPGIRSHMQKCIGDVYGGMDLTCDTYPPDDQVDAKSYENAIRSFQPGDVAIIFTPDDTHHPIALECIQHGMHVMVTKPIVQTLDHHRALAGAASNRNVLVAVEVHKRLDPFYADARDRARSLTKMGNFQYMYSYMSQPKHQLDTFRAWAGKSSDISYYLNSHHVDWSEWTLHGIARPIRVTGTCSNGIAHGKDIPTEDSITLTVQWENMNDGTLGCAVYTSSWVAPKSDVHSQQRFL